MKSKNVGLLFLLLIIVAVGQPRNSVAGWIQTNALQPNIGKTSDPDEYDLTPSVSAPVPDAEKYSNSSFRLLLRREEGLVVGVDGSASRGGKLVMDYDIRAIGSLDISNLTDKEVHAIAQTNEVALRVGYLRGRIFYKSAATHGIDWVTVFTSGDGRRIVVVTDEGYLRYSSDSGLYWTKIEAPGTYEFTLDSTPKGSRISAVISQAQTASTNRAKPTNSSRQDWYAITSAADGRQLILSEKPGEAIPALSITKTGTNVVLSWPSVIPNLFLQKTANLEIGEWQNITNAISRNNERNQVTLPIRDSSGFFRLRKM